MNVELVQPPEPFDPAELEKEVKRVVKQFDELKTGAEVRPLHDIVQDGVMPLIATLQKQIAVLAYYMSGHEDRIGDLEDTDDSRLVPEDAEPLLAYLAKCEDIFTDIAEKHGAEYPGIETMAVAARELSAMVQDITIPDVEPEGGDAAPN